MIACGRETRQPPASSTATSPLTTYISSAQRLLRISSSLPTSASSAQPWSTRRRKPYNRNRLLQGRRTRLPVHHTHGKPTNLPSTFMAGLAITEDAAEALKRYGQGRRHPKRRAAANYINRPCRRNRPTSRSARKTSVIKPRHSRRLSSLAAAHTRAFVKQFENQSASVRIADMPRDITFRVAGRNNADNIDVVALLMAAARTIPSTAYAIPPHPTTRTTPTIDAASRPTTPPSRYASSKRKARARTPTSKTAAAKSSAGALQEEELRRACRTFPPRHRRQRRRPPSKDEEEPRPRERRGDFFRWHIRPEKDKGRKNQLVADNEDSRSRDVEYDDDDRPANRRLRPRRCRRIRRLREREPRRNRPLAHPSTSSSAAQSIFRSPEDDDD